MVAVICQSVCIIVALAVLRVERSVSFSPQHRRLLHYRLTSGNVNTLHRRTTPSVDHQESQRRNAVVNKLSIIENCFGHKAKSYIRMMRPVTIIQAVGAFLVGRLVILTSSSSAASRSSLIQEVPNILAASMSVYLSYGAGMAMNDCADVAIDSMHEEKQHRSVASDDISMVNASLFCVALSVLSLIFSFSATSWKGSFHGFPAWTFFNLTIMAMYALGLQRIFLVKNLICGYLAIAPLIGASLLGGGMSILEGDVAGKLYQLAFIGFPLQVAREILKDIEDVKVDEGTKKTLPLVVGERTSKWIAYSLVAMVNGTMILSPYFWRMFKSTPNVYALSVAIGTPMCIRASMLPLSEGQQMLKKSIYVLLLGMISALLNQAR